MAKKEKRTPEFLELVARGAVAVGATAVPGATARGITGSVLTALSNYMAAAIERALPAGRRKDQASHPDAFAAMIPGSSWHRAGRRLRSPAPMGRQRDWGLRRSVAP
jgi:hypothetical protein